jgi:hypothetical protein
LRVQEITGFFQDARQYRSTLRASEPGLKNNQNADHACGSAGVSIARHDPGFKVSRV